MADETRSLAKLKESRDKIKDLYKSARKSIKEMRVGAAEANKVASKVPAYVLPIAGGALMYGTGYADARVQTPDVRAPVTMAAGAVSWAASGAAAYFGQPTLAALAAAGATAAAGVIGHSAGFEKGAKHAAAAG